MTGSISSLTPGATSTSGAASKSGAASSSTSSISQTGTSAMAGLNSNFSEFLTLLMTQLKNQDPSSPMDSSQFTSELVQFSSVEQQINTNSSLTQLIQLTQASQVEQSAAMIGKPLTVTSSQLSLQDGTAGIKFNMTSAEPVAISIFNSAGAQVQTATLTSQAGSNSWTWNGKNTNGASMPDGAYKVSVAAIGVGGSASQIPFLVTGTATAVQNNAGTVDVQMGGLTLPFSAVSSVGN